MQEKVEFFLGCSQTVLRWICMGEHWRMEVLVLPCRSTVGGGKVAVGSQGCEQTFVGPTTSGTMIVTVFLDRPSS